jgi:hypothetical protein
VASISHYRSANLFKVVLPPPYQRPPGAEFPAMGFSVELKMWVKARPPFELGFHRLMRWRKPVE